MTSHLTSLLFRLLMIAGSGAALAQAQAPAPASPATPPPGPQRIVSLLPSLTETVCTLGHCTRLVGVDRYSNWPDSVKRLPKVGGGMDPNIEAIVALRPDLVVLSPASRVDDRLRQLGLRTLVLPSETLDQTHSSFLQLAQQLGMAESQAQAQWAAIQKEVDEAASRIPAARRGQSVYFEASSGGWAASESSFIGHLLQRLGAVNVVPAHLGPFPRLSAEFVLKAQPQWVLASAGQWSEVARRPGWNTLPAWRSGQLCAFDAAQMDVLVRPGPRMGEAARDLAACLSGKGPHGR